jgi:carboxyl-terminal processing protease
MTAGAALSDESDTTMRDLFSTALDDIDQVYITPHDLPTLVTAALGGVSQLDPSLTVSFGAGQLTLKQGSRAIDQISLDPSQPPNAWGEAMAHLIATARSNSDTIARSSEQTVTDNVFAAMMKVLDRSSRYSSPSQTAKFLQAREGKSAKGGFHIKAERSNGQVVVESNSACVAPTSRFPRVGDMITEINGRRIDGLSDDAVARQLDEPDVDQMTMTVKRPGIAQPIQGIVHRQERTPGQIRTDRFDHIGYLQICTVDAATVASVTKAIDAFRAEGVSAYILDLRGSPGGLLKGVTEVSDLFLDHGTIATTHGHHPDSSMTFTATPGDIAESKPIIVLIDHGTAAGAEVLASALQSNGRAAIIGTPSLGRGSVQTILPLPDQGELTLTWSAFITPDGHSLDEEAVIPSICTPALATHPDWKSNIAASPPPRDEFPVASLSQGAPDFAAVRTACRSPVADSGTDPDVEVARQVLSDPLIYHRAVEIGRRKA